MKKKPRSRACIRGDDFFLLLLRLPVDLPGYGLAIDGRPQHGGNSLAEYRSTRRSLMSGGRFRWISWFWLIVWVRHENSPSRLHEYEKARQLEFRAGQKYG